MVKEEGQNFQFPISPPDFAWTKSRRAGNFQIKVVIFFVLGIIFLFISFYPTIFELSKSKSLGDPAREFILEHNFYWPDYNLYLSKIRQGTEGRLTALERFTSEPHAGSLIQEFYVVLGLLGKALRLNPNSSYQLGRIILSPLLLIMIYFLTKVFFEKFSWQILAFLIILSSGSFPRLFTDNNGAVHIGRFMEWWSNIDAVQRITFIPHILFGQVGSFFLLYWLIMKSRCSGIHDAVSTLPIQSESQTSSGQSNNLTMKQLILYILLGNAVGLVFPPSLITLDGVFLTLILIKLAGRVKIWSYLHRRESEPQFNRGKRLADTTNFLPDLSKLPYKQENFICELKQNLTIIIFTLPSLLYLFIITRMPPWSSLVIFHRTHPMLIPFWEYLLGTGPVFFLALLGILISLIKKDRKFHPLTFWIMTTFLFAILFTHIKEQSPLRFTQTGLFIPLGILATYFFKQLWELIAKLPYKELSVRHLFYFCYLLFVLCYLILNFYMIKISLNWQTNFITQRVRANIPPVPYPPQTMYPLKTWMEGIRWLKNNTARSDVVLAEITAGNFIPAYSGNTVYFGQSNTVNYEEKQRLVDKFFEGKMSLNEAQLFLRSGRIKYIFVSFQEKEKAGGKEFLDLYTMLKPVFHNSSVTIFLVNQRLF